MALKLAVINSTVNLIVSFGFNKSPTPYNFIFRLWLMSHLDPAEC